MNVRVDYIAVEENRHASTMMDLTVVSAGVATKRRGDHALVSVLRS